MEGNLDTVKTIEKIRIVSNNGVIMLVDQIDVKISIDDLMREKYKRGQSLNLDQWQKLIRQAVSFLAKNYSLSLLSNSPKNEAELKRRIEGKINNWLFQNKISVDKSVIDDLIHLNLDFLKEKKFIDDEAYVKSVLRKYKNKSKKEIFLKLTGKGVDKDVINKYLVDFNDKEREAVRACIIKKTRGKNELGRSEKRKLLASLYRKGFSAELAKTEIDDLTNNG